MPSNLIISDFQVVRVETVTIVDIVAETVQPVT